MVDPLPRRSVGLYRVERALEGHGREVYVSRRPAEQSNRRYILALFDVDEEQELELEAEVFRCMELDHPAVAAFVEIFREGRRSVLVLESRPGAPLDLLLDELERQDERLDDGAVIHIGVALFGALNAAHTATDDSGKTVPLVHAQIGPHQLLSSWDGEVKLLGLGLSTVFRLAAGIEPVPALAEPYLAPEVRRGGALTVRANVYSAAAMLAKLLMRSPPPAAGRTWPKMAEARPDLPPQLSATFDKALAISLLERRLTCATMLQALEASELADPSDLKAKLEPLRAAAIDGSALSSQSFPPANLSDVPAQSIPVLMSIPPEADDDDFALSEAPTQLMERPQLALEIAAARALEAIEMPPSSEAIEVDSSDIVAASGQQEPKAEDKTKAQPKTPPKLAPRGDARPDTARSRNARGPKRKATLIMGAVGSPRLDAKDPPANKPAGAPAAETPPAKAPAAKPPAGEAPAAKPKGRRDLSHRRRRAPEEDPMESTPDISAAVLIHAPDNERASPHTPRSPGVRLPYDKRPPRAAPKAAEDGDEEEGATGRAADGAPDAGGDDIPVLSDDADGAPQQQEREARLEEPGVGRAEASGDGRTEAPQDEGADDRAADDEEAREEAQPPPAKAQPPPPPLRPAPFVDPAPLGAAPPVPERPATPAPSPYLDELREDPLAPAPSRRGKWALLALGGVGVTLAIGFAVGRLSAPSAATASGTGSAPKPAAPSASRPAPAAAPAPTDTASPTADSTLDAGQDDARDAEADAADDAAAAGDSGFLTVTTSRAGAVVYVDGERAGSAGARLEVPCGAVTVRLGTSQPGVWLSAARRVEVACGDTTSTFIPAKGQGKPGGSLPSRPKRPTRPKGWSPDDI